MKLFYGYIVIFFNLSPTSSHLYPLQVENCDSNSRLVVDKDDNKFRPERVKLQDIALQKSKPFDLFNFCIKKLFQILGII